MRSVLWLNDCLERDWGSCWSGVWRCGKGGRCRIQDAACEPVPDQVNAGRNATSSLLLTVPETGIVPPLVEDRLSTSGAPVPISFLPIISTSVHLPILSKFYCHHSLENRRTHPPISPLPLFYTLLKTAWALFSILSLLPRHYLLRIIWESRENPRLKYCGRKAGQWPRSWSF